MNTETTYDEALIHFGVKGMKWGQTHANSSSGGHTTKVQSGKRREKVTTAQIKTARSQRQADLGKLIASDAKVQLATTAKGRQAALKVWEQQAKIVNAKDSTRIAAKMTRGERVATALFLGPLGVVAIKSNSRQTSQKGWQKQVARQNQRNAKTVARG
jgi:hypothetical protein